MSPAVLAGFRASERAAAMAAEVMARPGLEQASPAVEAVAAARPGAAPAWAVVMAARPGTAPAWEVAAAVAARPGAEEAVPARVEVQATVAVAPALATAGP